MSMMDMDVFKMVFGTPRSISTEVCDGNRNRYFNGNDLLVLLSLVFWIRPKVFVEFGINEGRTAKTILEAADWIDRYIGIDVPPNHVPVLSSQKSEVPQEVGWLVRGDPRVRLIVEEGGSSVVKPEDLAGVEMAFIDADHSYECVKADTRLVDAAMAKTGGLIVWHDYCKPYCEVRRFIDERNRIRNSVCLVNGSDVCFEIIRPDLSP